MYHTFRWAAALLALTVLFSLCGCGAKSGTAGSGGTINTDTSTVAVGAVIIARDDVDEKQVYDFVSTIFDNAESLSKLHEKGADLDLDFATKVTSVPYHPGAARYFAGKGYEVPTKEPVTAAAGSTLNLGTGNKVGTYYGYGSALAEYLSSTTKLTVSAKTSGGSKANLENLSAGSLQMAFVQSDIMSYAYQGQRMFSEPLENFSVVAAMYLEPLQLVTLDESINSVSDLKGHSVSIGAVGSGVYYNALDVLSAYGLSESDIQPIHLGFGASAESLKDGEISAAFIVAGAPTTAVTDLTRDNTVKLVPLDEEHVQVLVSEGPFYSPYTIPAGTY